MKCPKCGERGQIKCDERGVFFCAACMWERDRKPTRARHADVVKIGRNDPCPCGSGKKFKKCCLPNDQAHRPASGTVMPVVGDLK